MIKFKFDTGKYDFKGIVQDYLNIKDLSNAHSEYLDSGVVVKEGKDQRTSIHSSFYEKMDSDPIFKKTYDLFIKDFIKPKLFESEDIIFQRFPTFRAHYPMNLAVFEFHKDKDYNHDKNEINFFLPLTDCFETNTVWIESREDLGDFSPIVCEYGEIVMFDGANLKHGNKMNTTDITRISFDFRILKKSFYNEGIYKTSKTKGMKFSIGEYFQELESY